MLGEMNRERVARELLSIARDLMGAGFEAPTDLGISQSEMDAAMRKTDLIGKLNKLAKSLGESNWGPAISKYVSENGEAEGRKLLKKFGLTVKDIKWLAK